MRFLIRANLCVGLALACHATGLAAEQSPAASLSSSAPQRIEIAGVHHAFRVTGNVLSGSQPEGDKAFAALAKLGVKTIISVDGSKPDAESARRHGLRYIHLPIGYDSVPTNRIVELAKAADSPNGPVFVHCHHGLHRGPAAVAVICEAKENWTANQALAWLREAGTAADYGGLYRSVTAFQKPTPEQISAVTSLPEVAKTSSLVDAMVLIDEHFSRLKLCPKQAWKSPPGHADITPEHEALMLSEQLRELTCIDDTACRPPDCREILRNAKKAAQSLRHALGQPDNQSIENSFGNLSASCSACHQRYRNGLRFSSRLVRSQSTCVRVHEAGRTLPLGEVATRGIDS